MRVRSSGLGKTEMVMKQEKIGVENGYIMMYLRSSEPANWHIRIVLDRKDIWHFIVSLLKGTIFVWLFSLTKKMGPAPPEY